MTDDTLTVFSDFVCPFCYLGRASLRRYLEEAADPPEVEWQFFDLRGYQRGPDGRLRDDVEDGKDEEYFEQVRENVDRLRERYGVEMVDLDAVPDADSWDAQQAALHVRQTREPETFEAFYHGLFDALWRDARDVSDPDVLADVAAEAGADPAAVRDAVDDERLEADLRSRFEEAEDLGVTGIPTFVYGGHAARGAVPPAQLRRLVEGD
ncbi:MAG: DsbA family protein [Halobacteriaceae archaeon]